MSADDIIKIINSIPEYIIYIYPGYITIYLYYFFRGKTLKDTKQILLKSILLSYIYITITDFIPVSNVFWITLGYLALSTTIAYVGYRITISNLILRIFDFIKIHTTFYENDIESLAGIENSAWLIVYLKDEPVAYEGSLGNKELEDSKNKFITLEGYTKHKINTDGSLGEIICSYEGNYKEQCVIKYDEIRCIEKRDTTPLE